MAGSLRASPHGLEIVDQARKRKGWTKTMTVAWWEMALTSQATLRRFWRKQPIQQESFINICKAVGIGNWQDIADINLDSAEVPPITLIDWGEAPDVSVFYGRTQEQDVLQQWIVTERCRLVALLGIGGVGKTALAATLADSIQDKFQYIVWRSLRSAPTAAELLADWLRCLSLQYSVEDQLLLDSTDVMLSKLMSQLHKHRCLLILDDFAKVLKSGDIAGNYRSGYEGYGEIISRIAQERHQSCLLLVSREKPRDIALLEGETLPVRSRLLDNLDPWTAQEIFRAKGLADENTWLRIIKMYGANPLVLKIVAAAVKESFNGRVAEFLKQNTIFLGYISDILDQQFERLSDLEKAIMHQLAIHSQPLSLAHLQQNLAQDISGSELIYALESLGRRSLIEKIPEDTGLIYTLQPVIKKYVKKLYNM